MLSVNISGWPDASPIPDIDRKDVPGGNGVGGALEARPGVSYVVDIPRESSKGGGAGAACVVTILGGNPGEACPPCPYDE